VVNGKERIRLVTCESCSLSQSEKSYAVVELEALAIKYAVEKCRYYLLGMQKFTASGVNRSTKSAMQDARSGGRTSPSTTST
jgi:hypothetical protein